MSERKIRFITLSVFVWVTDLKVGFYGSNDPYFFNYNIRWLTPNNSIDFQHYIWYIILARRGEIIFKEGYFLCLLDGLKDLVALSSCPVTSISVMIGDMSAPKSWMTAKSMTSSAIETTVIGDTPPFDGVP